MLSLTALALPFGSLPAVAATSAANLAMIAEPQTLDPMGTTADLVGTLMQHMSQPLHLDANWKVVPMLAEELKISRMGLPYTIALRKGSSFTTAVKWSLTT